VTRRCIQTTPDGGLCGAPPLVGERYCYMHHPKKAEKAEEVAEARKLGGMRRRRERAVAGAYEFEGFGTIDSIRRIVNIATFDAFGLENSIARGRLLISAALAAVKLHEVGELEARVALLELTQQARRRADDEVDAFRDDAA
jgi:hypothetical protein